MWSDVIQFAGETTESEDRFAPFRVICGRGGPRRQSLHE
jgi:hypothetical protein